MSQLADPHAVIAEGRLTAPPPALPPCPHSRVVIDEKGGLVNCRDCLAPLSAFQVLLRASRHEGAWAARLRSLKADCADLESWGPRMRVTRELERIWRVGDLLPVCPHCRRGLWPDELMGHRHHVDFELSERERLGVSLPPLALAPQRRAPATEISK